MKNVLFLILFLTMGFGLLAQTPYSIFNSANEKGIGIKQISAKNVWLGSKLVYNVSEDNPIDDNFALSGKVLYTPIFGDKYGIPIVVTAGSGGDILNPESGTNIGVYPYYVLTSTSGMTLLAHGGVGYKSLQQETEALQQIRALIGLEVAFAGKAGGPPVTFSLTPVYTNTSGTLGNKTFLEATTIIPVSKNLGALVDWTSSGDQSFRIGIIVNAGLK